jgi:hypothetical protein
MGKKKLLDQLSDIIRLKRYGIRTEQTYLNWIGRLMVFYNKRHPAEMGQGEMGKSRSGLHSPFLSFILSRMNGLLPKSLFAQSKPFLINLGLAPGSNN